MADDVVARDESKPFPIHPEGQFAAVCVDTVDLGLRVEQFEGKAKKLTSKCAIVYATGASDPDTGEMLTVAPELTVSMYETSGLRVLLEAWRGKSYTEEQAKDGVKLAKMVGHPALIVVEHKRSGKGRSYAKIKAIMPLPEGMPKAILPAEYVRADFWDKRKKAYAAEVVEFRKGAQRPVGAAAGGNGNFSDYPEALDEEDDDLPF